MTAPGGSDPLDALGCDIVLAAIHWHVSRTTKLTAGSDRSPRADELRRQLRAQHTRRLDEAVARYLTELEGGFSEVRTAVAS